MIFRPRRTALMTLVALAACSLVPSLARSQTYPSQTIKFIIPAGAGGLAGHGRAHPRPVVCRSGSANRWSSRTRPGGNGSISVAALMASPPDGYTFIVQDGSIYAINPHIYAKMTYKVSDLTPTVMIAQCAAVSCCALEGAGEDYEGVHRLRESQPRQAQLRLVRRRLHASSVDGGDQGFAPPAS